MLESYPPKSIILVRRLAVTSGFTAAGCVDVAGSAEARGCAHVNERRPHASHAQALVVLVSCAFQPAASIFSHAHTRVRAESLVKTQAPEVGTESMYTRMYVYVHGAMAPDMEHVYHTPWRHRKHARIRAWRQKSEQNARACTRACAGGCQPPSPSVGDSRTPSSKNRKHIRQ